MKKTGSILLILTLCLSLLAACGKKEVKNPDMADVVSAVDQAIGNTGDMLVRDEDYVSGFMKIDVSKLSAYTVKTNSVGVSIDEYGVFQAADSGSVKTLKESVDAYLQMRVDTWMTEYMPEEQPKLLSAQVWTEGNYVMYAILGDTTREAASTAFSSCFAG